MAAEMVSSRETTVHIGTTAATASTDTYVEIENVRAIEGAAGITWSQIDATVLKDLYKQTRKGVADAGTLTLGGPIKKDASTGLATGLAALKTAAADESHGIYNFKFVQADGRIQYKKAIVFSFTEQVGNNSNLLEFRSILIFQAAHTEAAAA